MEAGRKETIFVPDCSELCHKLASVYPSVVQDNKSVLLYPERKAIKKVYDFVDSDVFSRTKTVITIVAVYHAEYIKPHSFL